MTDSDRTADPLQSALSPRGAFDPAQSADLVRRAQKGDDLALNELLERYRPRLRRIVRIRLGAKLRGRLESMDIVQETYQVAFRKIADLQVHSQASILQWLSRIAEHKITDANDYFTALRRDARREEPIDGQPGESRATDRLPDEAESPSQQLERSEIREILDGCVEQLSEAQREVVILRDYCGGEWEFVAEEMESNAHAAQELHRRAWVKLRSLAGPKLGRG